jgi:hypothetical protein
MAEQVKRRVNAARIAVAFAAAGVIAGGAATATGARDPIPPNSIGTQEVRNGTLLWKDLKDGEVYSKDQVAEKFLKVDEASDKWLKIDDANEKFLKIDDANEKFLKIDEAANTYVKGEALNTYVKVESLAEALNSYVKGDSLAEALNSYVKGDSLAEALNSYIKQSVADTTFLKIADAANTYVKTAVLSDYLTQKDAAATYVKGDALTSYLKTEDAANQYIKLGDAVMGDGSVFTGVVTVPEGGADKLLTVDRFFEVDIEAGDTTKPALVINRLDGVEGPVHFATDGAGGTLDNSAAIEFDGSADTQVIQLQWGAGDKPMVATLSVSVVPTNTSGVPAVQSFAQILIGL